MIQKCDVFEMISEGREINLLESIEFNNLIIYFWCVNVALLLEKKNGEEN